VLATREPSQHLAGLAFVARLAEDRAVQENERVGGEDPIGGVERGGRGGLLARETRRGVPARLTRRDRFVDAGRDGGERNAERREDLRTTGRAGGEEKTHEPGNVKRKTENVKTGRENRSVAFLRFLFPV
jgi:hypothetical protein